MSKSLVIDFKVLKGQGIDALDLLYLFSLSKKGEVDYVICKDDVDFESLIKKLFIKVIDDEVFLRQRSIELIEFLTIKTEGSFEVKKTKSKSSRVLLSVIEERVDEFRSKWRGLKPGSMGSKQACKTKLNRWMKENPDYNFDEILKAADLYLSTEGTNLRFLQRADYFIYKQDANREENSRLSAYIDDIDDSDTGDWTTNLI